MEKTPLQTIVSEKYSTALAAAVSNSNPSAFAAWDPIISNNYSQKEQNELPEEVFKASFGCGNPTVLAPISPGQVVLDLGSGGGIDVFLSAKKVGPTGKVYGLDMTDAMLEAARVSALKSGITNVEFIKGTIENIPLPDNTVDVIISNCVVNLSGDKDKVFAEAFRVLKPGGRFAISDILLTRTLPSFAVESMRLWTGCISGALEEIECIEKMKKAGFHDASVQRIKVYSREDAESMARGSNCCGENLNDVVEKKNPTSTSSCCSSIATNQSSCCNSNAPTTKKSDFTIIDQELITALDGAITSAFIRGTKSVV